MTRSTLKVAAATLALTIAAPLFAQTPPPAPTAPREVQIRRISPAMEFHGDRFEGMSPEGRAILREAMKPQVTPQDRDAVKAARKKVLGLIAADKLDVPAVRSAQAAERDLVVKQHERQQAAMLAAYQKLSAADRKAFVGGMRDRQERMLDSLKKSRERIEEMEKRMKERMKERETGSVGLDDVMPLQPIVYTAGR